MSIRLMIVGSLVVVALLAGCRNREQSMLDIPKEPRQPVAERVVGNLQEPVSLVFLSKDLWLVAERRTGVIRRVQRGAVLKEPFASVTVPNLPGYTEYGLLGLAVDPDYPHSPYVYAFHTAASPDGKVAGQRIVRFTVRDGKGVDQQTIVDNLPAGTSCCHNGGRLLFGQDGKLYVTLGDTQKPELAQQYDALPGKVLRYNPDGTIPADNPLESQQTAWIGNSDKEQSLNIAKLPVYAIGFRNPFGIANAPSGDIYLSDNGPDTNDRIVRLVAGDNYGWPSLLNAPPDDPRFHAPLWTTGNTTIAPTGMAFYTGDGLPQYRNNLFFAAYKDGRLRRAVFDGRDRITHVEAVPAAGANAKLDVVMGPDGDLYFTSMNAIYRLIGK